MSDAGGGTAAAPAGGGAKILIVDDEPANVRVLERMLRSGGFTELRWTTDPREVPGLVEEMAPDLVMLDLQMPHADGFAVLEGLRSRPAPDPYLPVLVLTADTTPRARQRALAGGAKDFVTKPFDLAEVLARTRNLLETRSLHLALQAENRLLEGQLAYQAFHDPLTGLANRALFRDRVRHALARSARGGRSAVLFLDLDDFKSVNDSLGHAEGDRLLEAVAARLLSATRGCDTVARLGGDEFAVLLEGMAHEGDATLVIERITTALSWPFALQGREVCARASIGVAHARGGEGVDELLRNADVAMYRAKEARTGRHEVFEPAMHAAVLERLELEADLRQALARGEFRLLYQPIVEMDSGRVTGAEALIRWQHPTRGLLSPAAFILVAEQTGLIVPIGRWVLAEACRQGGQWQREAPDGEGPRLSVNISGRQLREPAFAAEVAAALADSGLAPDRLTLELTESVLIDNTEATLARLHELRSLGVRLAIDDFGTGYSSLSYLQRFPLDVLKIDKSFVDGVARGGSDAALARMIVTLAGVLKLRTVAEGVEHDEQRAQLMALGCDVGQGYLFARPLPAEDVGALLGAVPTPATS